MVFVLTPHLQQVRQQRGPEFSREVLPGMGVRALHPGQVPIQPGGVTGGVDDFVGPGGVVGTGGMERCSGW